MIAMALGRRDLLGGVVGLAAAGARQSGAQTAQRPNILLIFMDDMTHRAIGGLTNPEVQTPNIDRLMRRGTIFTHAFNQGAWSGAVCIPSRAMLITGLTLWHARDRMETTPLLGETISRAGYTTFFTGKWHNGPETLRRSYQQVGPHEGGFLMSTPVGGDAYDRPSPGNRWDPADTTRKGHWLEVKGEGGEAHIVHSSVRWADSAIGFLHEQAAAAKRTGRKPFFLHVAFHGPHDPRQAPQEFLDRYPRDKIGVPPNYLPQHPFDQGDFRTRDELLAPFPRTHDAVRLHRREYYAILTHADQQIGRILDALDSSGLADDTLIVFSGDHGLAVGEHGLMGKQNQYDHSVRVPLIFAGPGVPSGKRVDAMVYQNGIYPTVCALAGIPIPKEVENRNLAGLIRGTETEGFEAIFGAMVENQRMIRTRDEKLIVYPQVKRVQLFSVREDPWEIHDRSADPKNAPRIAQLWNRLNALQHELDDPMPVPPFPYAA